jgi:hypothetical protein
MLSLFGRNRSPVLVPQDSRAAEFVNVLSQNARKRPDELYTVGSLDFQPLVLAELIRHAHGDVYIRRIRLDVSVFQDISVIAAANELFQEWPNVKAKVHVFAADRNDADAIKTALGQGTKFADRIVTYTARPGEPVDSCRDFVIAGDGWWTGSGDYAWDGTYMFNSFSKSAELLREWMLFVSAVN